MTPTNTTHAAPQDVATRFDSSTGTVYATVDIASPPAAVFRALTAPNELTRWWGSPEWYRTRDWKLDLRPGGLWSVRIMRPDGEMTLGGEIVAVREPSLLEYTWCAEFDDFHPTTVRYELSERLVNGIAGTRLEITHTGMKHQDTLGQRYSSGWVKTLEWLASHVAAPR